MLDSYKNDIEWSKSNRKKIAQASKKLTSNNHIDKIINKLHDDVFENVNCLNCANCCKTVGPLLTSTDIRRLSKHQKMSESDFVDAYLRLDEDDDFVFKTMPCPFLLEDNSCSVYTIRPRACRGFPHTDQQGQKAIMELTRKNAKVCPAVSRIFQHLSA